MGYKSEKFIDGQVLTHEHMNNIIDGINEKQNILISGDNIKTINGESILGSGDIAIVGDSSNFLIKKILIKTNGYNIDGFIRPAGTESDSTSYKKTDYIDVSNFIKIEVNVYAGSSSVSPVVWYDADKKYISGETATIYNALTTFEYNVPTNAKYARFSTSRDKGSHVYSISNGTLEEYITSFLPEDSTQDVTGDILNVCYISPDGVDTNSGASSSSPIKTFARAKKILSREGELIFLDGEYENFSIDLSYFAKISTVGQNAVLTYPKYKVTSAETHPTYSNVFVANIPDNVNEFNTFLWQHKINDAETLILNEERHPLQKKRTHRLVNTRIHNISTLNNTPTNNDEFIAAVASNEHYSYYIDTINGILYFTAPSNDFTTHPIVFSSSSIVSGSTRRKVNISGLNIMYGFLQTAGLSGEINNVSAGYMYHAGCIRWDNTFDMVFRNCEAAAGGIDGFNGHSDGNITCYDCWGHDCFDDGESDHEKCHITQYGGLYEYNGAGCTPASGGSGLYYNVVSRKNGTLYWSDTQGTGFSAQGEAANIICNGCLALDNSGVGFKASGTNTVGAYINCVSNTGFGLGTQYNSFNNQ